MPKRKPDAGRTPDSLKVLTQPHAQVELCGRIITGAMGHVEDYLRKHPQWTGDERSEAGVEMFQLWIGEVCELVCEYSIQYRNEESK